MSETNFQESSQEIKTVAVLGGSGFIGTYLVLNLLQLGCRVNLLSNKTEPGFKSTRGQIRIFSGSIENDVALANCLEGCEIVYHLVGIIAETRDKTFEKTVSQGTGNVVQAAKARGIKKIIYLSALGTSENADSVYFQSKYKAEQHIINSGMDYTIFRPSIVYGVRDQFINKLAKMVKYLPIVPVIGNGQYKLQPVYVEELAALMADTLRRSNLSNRIFEIGGPEQLTYLEIIDIIKRVLRRKRARIHIPFLLVKFMAVIMEKILRPAPITVDQLKMMKAGSTCDHTVAETEFGVKFSPLELKLQEYLGKMYGKRI